MKKETKRIILDILALLFIMLIFSTETYKSLLKAVLLNIGILHAHITRKMLFPSVDWSMKPIGGTYVAIALYIVIPICYAFGG